MATKDAITCHVLDTTTGRPGAGIKVTLHHQAAFIKTQWDARTDADGRISNWVPIDASSISVVSNLCANPNPVSTSQFSEKTDSKD
jgi:5-hydroxyisourate hydrolase